MNAGQAQARLELRAPLREVWSAPTFIPSGAPALVAGEGLLFARDGDGRLVALEIASGRRVWSYPWSVNAVLLHAGQLLAWAERHEAHVIELGTGKPAGCLPLPEPADALGVGPHVVLQATDQEHGAIRLLCAEAQSGLRVWTRSWPGYEAGVFAASREIVVGQPDGEMLVLDVSSGALRWSHSWPPEWGWQDGQTFRLAQPTRVFLFGDRLIANVGGHVVCLSSKDGRTQWDVKGFAHSLYGGRIFAAGSEYEVRNAANGALVLRSECAKGAPRAVAAAGFTGAWVHLVSETHTFVNTYDGILVAVERDTGKYAWHHQPKARGRVETPVIAAGGRLFYVTGGRLFCLEPRE